MKTYIVDFWYFDKISLIDNCMTTVSVKANDVVDGYMKALDELCKTVPFFDLKSYTIKEGNKVFIYDYTDEQISEMIAEHEKEVKNNNGA